jgi:hypothetical protein
MQGRRLDASLHSNHFARFVGARVHTPIIGPVLLPIVDRLFRAFDRMSWILRGYSMDTGVRLGG